MKLRSLFVVAVAVLSFELAPVALAQGNFDPAQMRERQMERHRERIEVKSDEDWKKIEPLVGKVMDAQRDARAFSGFGGGFGGFGGFGGRGGGGRGGGGGGGGTGGGDGGGNNAAQGQGEGQGGNRNRGGFQTPAEITELRKAVDDKASPDEIKAKVAKLREARKQKEAAVDKAQEELRKALSPRQEAGAILAGLLK